MSCSQNEQILIITQTVTGVLFLISEYLGWSQCKANSVSEWFLGRCFGADWFIKKVNVVETLPNNAVTAPVLNDGVNQTVIDSREGDLGNRKGSGKTSEIEIEVEKRIEESGGTKGNAL